MAATQARVPLWSLGLVWALTAAAYAGRAFYNSATTPLFVDTDDAMRLNEVHDFLKGQSWFDLVQHRLNTPYGAELHWSRLIDLPEATLLWLLRLVAGGAADAVLGYVWPLLLLGPLLWLTGKLALVLGGRLALWPGLLLPPFGIIALTEFVPGRVDHHSVQALLTLVMLFCSLLALTRPRFALGAGVAAGAALAIGIEGLPLVAAAVLAFALMWVASTRHAVALRDFGLSFALATALALAQGVPPAGWLNLRLDAISAVYAAAALLGGLAFLALSMLPLRTLPARLGAALLAGAVVVGLLLTIDPAILEGPYAALDPWLVSHWLANISESQTWLRAFREDPVYPLSVTVPISLALALAAWRAVRSPSERPTWLIYGLFLVVGLAVMVVQIRGGRIATPLAVPGGAALVAAAWGAFAKHKRVVRALGVFVSALGSAGIVVAAAVALVVPSPQPADMAPAGPGGNCLLPSAFADLARLPPERVMAPIDLGSHLLLFTPHSVVGAPYHRNQQGLLDTFHFVNEPIDAAHQLLVDRGIGLVVICPSMSEIRGMTKRAPDSFVTLYAANRLPDWLVDQSMPGSPLRIYSVRTPWTR